MGTIRNSRMSITLLSECSHVNLTSFVRNGFDPNEVAPQNFTDYELGRSSPFQDIPLHENATFVIYDDEEWIISSHYRLEYRDYKVVPGTDYVNWVPVPFLADNLNRSFLIDNVTASSSLILILNR